MLRRSSAMIGRHVTYRLVCGISVSELPNIAQQRGDMRKTRRVRHRASPVAPDAAISGAFSAERLEASATSPSTVGVASVTPPAVSAVSSAAVLTVTPTTGPQDDATLALLDELRAAVPEGIHIGVSPPPWTTSPRSWSTTCGSSSR